MDPLQQKLRMAERLAAITQQVGFAMWQLQELESVTAQYFVLLTQAKKGMGLAVGSALVEKAQTKTFGATIAQVSKAGLVSPELVLRFNNLLAERNWLVHKSRASSRNAVHNDADMQKLLARLDIMSEESVSLLRDVGELAASFVQQHGVSEAFIEEYANKLLDQWHSADPA